MDHIINLGLQIVPKSTEKETYDLVDIAIEVIRKSGVRYEVTPFETVMEGTQVKLMEIAQDAQKAVLDAGADEVLVYIRIHAASSKPILMLDKVGKHKRG